MRKLTLSMIVKDEAPVIKRCLLSVIPFIDYYVISDTGSSDNTKQIIKETMDQAGIQGEIFDDKWEDFGHNRSLALKHCYGKTQWVLMIDADDNIEGEFPVEKLSDSVDSYTVLISKDGCSWRRTQVFNLTRKNWKYVEPLHEYPCCGESSVSGDLDGNYRWIARCEGNRNQNPTEKYKKDYLLLKSFLEKNPKDSRKQFYAAQSAYDAGLFEEAEKEYLNRINLGGWHEEVFYSWFKIGKIRWATNKSTESIVDAFTRAFEASPSRLEPIYHLSWYYRSIGRYRAAFMIALAGLNIKKTNDVLFLEDSCYTWGILDEVATTAFYSDRPDIGIPCCKKLLKENLLPKDHVGRVLENLKLYCKHFPDYKDTSV